MGPKIVSIHVYTPPAHASSVACQSDGQCSDELGVTTSARPTQPLLVEFRHGFWLQVYRAPSLQPAVDTGIIGNDYGHVAACQSVS
ncbi:hypothetical protein VTN96DRAFT_9411 [Rasamsonia emersonii]